MELINQLKNWYHQIDQNIFHRSALALARKMYFIWIFVNYLILATEANFFYKADNYITLKEFDKMNAFEKSINILNSIDYNFLYPYFILGILIFSTFGIFDKIIQHQQRMIAIVTYFLMINLDNRAYVILDGGNNLVHLIGFYLMFVDTQNIKNTKSILITNLASLMIKIQICFVYATAGLLKVMGPLWNKGIALYYTMGVPEYGSDQLFKIFSQFPVLVVLFTFGTVIFQISFPYLIWNKTFRPLVILIGTSLHFSISFVMGLFMFGAAMCMSYFFFKTDNTGIVYEN